MIRSDLRNWYVAVVSSGRPENVAPLTALIGPATWFVQDDAPEYLAEARKLKTHTPTIVHVDDRNPKGRLPRVRNIALEHAFRHDAVCVMCDDDLQSFSRDKVIKRGKRKGETQCEGIKLEFGHVINEFWAAFQNVPEAHLAGLPAKHHSCWMAAVKNEVYHTHGFIITRLIAVRPTHLRFDPTFTLKEDYDYSCQHLEEYGAVVRVEQVYAEYLRWENKGGLQAHNVRGEAQERSANAQLMAKWPGVFRENAGHSHGGQLVMRWPLKRKKYEAQQRNLFD